MNPTTFVKRIDESKQLPAPFNSFDPFAALRPSIDPYYDFPRFELFQAAFNRVNSYDPNDLAGPTGFSGAHVLRPEQSLPYTIRFENDPLKASAPAQEVVVTQTLDSDLDWTTFELGDFGFGSLIVSVPHGVQSYRTRLDYNNQDGSALFVVLRQTMCAG